MDSFSILNQNHLQQALKALKIRTNLITNEQYLLEDPIRNGLLLYQILQEISLIQKKPNNPAKTLSECRENLLISLESLVKTPKIYNRLFSDIAESILKGNTYFIESIVNYINTHQHSHLRLNSLNFDKFLETFSKDFENNKKEKNLIEWLKDLGLFNKESLLSFDQILQETVKGDLLFKIYNKYNTKKMEPIRRFPKNDVNYLANLRKFLSHVRKIKNFPQKYLWMEAEIVKGSNKDLILGFLEDIKTGLENGYNEKTNISFEINSKDKQINLKTSQQFNDEIRGKMHCLISEREMKEMKFSERKYIEKKLEEKKFVPGETEAFQWLESLGFVNLVKELKENNEFWLEFQDGYQNINFSQIFNFKIKF